MCSILTSAPASTTSSSPASASASCRSRKRNWIIVVRVHGNIGKLIRNIVICSLISTLLPVSFGSTDGLRKTTVLNSTKAVFKSLGESLLTSLMSFSSSVVFFLESLNSRTWKYTNVSFNCYQTTWRLAQPGLPATPSCLCVYILLCSYSSGLKVALCFLQLVGDELLDGLSLIFVYKLLNGFSHALLSQQGQLDLL